MRRALIRLTRRWLYIIHRWIGIVTCLLFAMWFASGVVMMYVAFPQLTSRERWAASPPIAWNRVQVTPDRAMAIAGFTSYPRDLSLVMLDDTPVYRLSDWNGARKTLSAIDGYPIDGITSEQALAIASHYPGAVHPEIIGTITRDQWSVTAHYDPLRPLYLVSLGDPGVLRAVIGGGLYLAMLGLFALAIGAIVRHTAAAITGVIGFVLVLAPLA